MDQRLWSLEQQVVLRKQQIASIDEEAKKFLELRLQGFHTPEIAQAHGVTQSHVTNAILEYEKRYGLPPSHNATRAAVADECAKKFRALKLQGVSLQEIAKMYGISISSVSQAITRYEERQGLPSFRISHSKRAIQPHRDRPIVEETADVRSEKFRSLKLQGLTLEEIGETYGISRERVRQLIARYEKKHGLSPAIPASRKVKASARKADIEEYKAEQRFEKQKQYKRFVPTFQLDTHLIGKFLKELGNKAVLYGFDGKSRCNPKKRKDGSLYPSQIEPTNIFINYHRKHLTLHSWVLQQNGVGLEEGQHCHHIDGDITNNMFENLQVISNVEHGRITMLEQMEKGTIDFDDLSRRLRGLTDEQVEEIRALYRPRVTSVSSLAQTYGVHESTVRAAIFGQGAYINVNPATCRVQKKGSKSAQELRAKQMMLDFGP